MVLVFAIVAISSTFLCGCQYFEIDEYLEKFGLTDSDYDDSSFLETEEIASEDKEATAEADNIDSDPDKNKPADFDFSSFYRKFFDTDDDGDVKSNKKRDSFIVSLQSFYYLCRQFNITQKRNSI